MIKKVAIVFLLVMAGILSGCGAANDGGVQTGAAQTSQETAAPSASASSVLTPGSSASPSPATVSSPAASGSVSAEEQEIIDSFISVEAPDFTFTRADGSKVTLEDIKGKPAVLNFWATWCPYCVQEFPYFTQAQKDFPEIQFLGVDTSEKTDLSDQANREKNVQFARENGFDIPIVFDVGSAASKGAYTTQGLPSTFFIDAKGIVRLYFAGAVQDYEMLKTYLGAFLKVKAWKNHA